MRPALAKPRKITVPKPVVDKTTVNDGQLPPLFQPGRTRVEAIPHALRLGAHSAQPGRPQGRGTIAKNWRL